MAKMWKQKANWSMQTEKQAVISCAAPRLNSKEYLQKINFVQEYIHYIIKYKITSYELTGCGFEYYCR